MRIVLFCDQKWRDLPSLTVVKLYLEQAGHRVFIISTKEAEQLLPAIKPHCVVFNHILDKRYVDLAHRLKRSGTHVVILPTEGATPTFLWGPMVHGEFTDYSMVDLYLSWNQITVDGIVAAGSIPAENMRVIGCPRFDFAVDPLRQSCMSRGEFCANFDLDPSRPIVTFASRFALAKMTYASDAVMKAMQEQLYELGFAQCVEQLGYRLDEVFPYYREGLDSFIESFIAVAKAFPECQVLFKPHPNDDVKYIQDAVAAELPDNGSFCLGAYIGDVLRASDVLVNSDCNTSMEAWIQGVPVVDVQIKPDPITGREDIQAANPVARHVEEAVDLVGQALAGAKPTAEMRLNRKSVLDTWFDVVDGRRSEAAAEAIDTYLRSADKRAGGGLPLADQGVRQAVRAVLRHVLSVPGGLSIRQHLLSRGGPVYHGVGVFDKVITRRDVKVMEGRLRPLLPDTEARG